jgi:hypothetical protein
MCLVTYQQKPKVVKKDMTVYKELSVYKGNVYSTHYGFVYEIGVLYSVEMRYDKHALYIADLIVSAAYPKWDSDKRLTHVHESFHASVHQDRPWYGLNYRCTIPKGSLVFYDKTGLCASNQIIIEGPIESL